MLLRFTIPSSLFTSWLTWDSQTCTGHSADFNSVVFNIPIYFNYYYLLCGYLGNKNLPELIRKSQRWNKCKNSIIAIYKVFDCSEFLFQFRFTFAISTSFWVSEKAIGTSFSDTMQSASTKNGAFQSNTVLIGLTRENC